MGMRDRARESAERTNQRLAEKERELISQTTIDWDAMKPQIGSESDYQRLMDAVQQSTDRNETVGAVIQRLEALGSEGIALAKKVRGIIAG